MKRLLSLILVLAFCLGLTGCVNEEQKRLKETMDEANGYTTVDYTMDDGTTLEEQVIYDKNNIKVTVLGLTGDGIWGTLWYRVENNSDETIDFEVNGMTINGWDVDVGDGMSLNAGKMEKRSIYLDDSDMERLDTVSTIGSLTLDCQISSTNGDIVFTTNELKTSAYGQQEEFDLSSGQVLYDKNDVKLVSLGMMEEYNDYDDGYAAMLFYVENNRKYDIYLENGGENGGEITLADGRKLASYFGDTVSANAKKLCLLSLYPADIYDEEYDEEDDEWYDEEVETWVEEEDDGWYDEDESFDWSEYFPLTMDLMIHEERKNNMKTVDTVENLTFGEGTPERETDTPVMEGTGS